MPFSFLLIVLTTTIIAFFSEEIGAAIKKFFKIRGTKLIIPLAIVSWLVMEYEQWMVWFILCYNLVWQYFVLKLSFIINIKVAYILILFLLSNLPVWAYYIYLKRKRLAIKLKPAYLTGLVLWITAAILFIVAHIVQ